MEADLRGLHSSDIDFDSFTPAQPDNFGFHLTVFVGPRGQEGEESFNTYVCTPRWFIENRLGDRPLHGIGHFFVNRFELNAIENEIRSIVASATGADWTEIGNKLDRDLGTWEFRDYRPAD